MSEIRQNLQKHAFSEAVIEHTLTRLQETGLLNDQQFAEAWVENRSTFRPRARRALALELRPQRRGGRPHPRDPRPNRRRGNPGAPGRPQIPAEGRTRLEWPAFRAKLGGFLARRGFSYDVIDPVLRGLWGETRSKSKTHPNENEELE